MPATTSPTSPTCAFTATEGFGGIESTPPLPLILHSKAGDFTIIFCNEGAFGLVVPDDELAERDEDEEDVVEQVDESEFWRDL